MSWPWLHLEYDGKVCCLVFPLNYCGVLVFVFFCFLIKQHFYFQGKVVHQGLSIQSSFSQRVRLQQILSLTEDMRFYYKRLRSNRVELEPRRKTKVCVPFHRTCTSSLILKAISFYCKICINAFFFFVFFFQIANIYFDAGTQCGDHCYVGLPFVLKCK